jgi:hypothetical protein
MAHGLGGSAFAEYEPVVDIFGFRYGGWEWAIYQDRDSHRCIAIAFEGDSQQSKTASATTSWISDETADDQRGDGSHL